MTIDDLHIFFRYYKTMEVSSILRFTSLYKTAQSADEFSTDAFGEMLAIIYKCRSSKTKKSNSEFKKMPPPLPSTFMWHNKISIPTFQTCMCVFVETNPAKRLTNMCPPPT